MGTCMSRIEFPSSSVTLRSVAIHGVTALSDGKSRAQAVVTYCTSEDRSKLWISWPLPADRRLDQLVDLANEAGAGARRNELAAAIVAAAEPDGEALLPFVLCWRRSKVRDVIVNPPQESSVIHFPRYGPGRRKAE